MNAICRAGEVRIGPGLPLVVIGGPCVLESQEMALSIGDSLVKTCASLGLPFIFKASFDKANRTSSDSPRGPGLARGLDALSHIGERLGAPVTTDVHEPEQAQRVADVVDLLQIPAFLCRQTDLLMAVGEAAASKGRGVNIKKGQFLSPGEMAGPIGKILETGCDNLLSTERGTFFGYHRLVNDFLGVGDLMELRVREQGPWPVCFDCTHSTQLPGAGRTSGGRPERAPALARAAVAIGVHAVFIECHPSPEQGLSDAATMLPLAKVAPLLRSLSQIHALLVDNEQGVEDR